MVVSYLPGCIVEVGAGFSTYILLDIAKKYDRKLYSCDSGRGIRRVKNIEHDNFQLFKGSSQSFMQQFDDTPCVVFLDGCHDYEVVKQEVEFFLTKLVKHGIILIHDTLPPDEWHVRRRACSDAWKVRVECELDHNLWCFTWPFGSKGVGLTMIAKNEPHYL